MILLTIVLMLAGCVARMEEVPHPFAARDDVVITSESFDVDIRDGFFLNVDVASTDNDKPSNSSVKKRLMLVATPTEECIARGKQTKPLPIVVSRHDASYQLSSTKPLTDGGIYGLYDQQGDGRDEFCLRYVFRARGAPRLLSHDLGPYERKLVRSDRRRIRLSFDQDVLFASDGAVIIIAKNGERILFDAIVQDADQKTLWLYLMPDQLIAGAVYTLRLGAHLTNSLGWPVDEQSINFVVENSSATTSVTPAPRFLVSAHEAELRWQLAGEQRVDVFMRQEGEASYALMPAAIKHDPLIAATAHNLIATTTYDYILRSEDAHGLVSVAQGSFTTGAARGVSINEIMADPITHELKQSAGEYVELINRGPRMSLAGMSLAVEDVVTHKTVSCDLSTEMIIGTDDYVLIVGKEFKPSLFRLSGEEKILRLDKKSLCNGLVNGGTKSFRLFDDDGFVVDHLKAPAAKKGQAFIRSRSEGLDDERKYCYSTPTPGKQNASCG